MTEIRTSAITILSASVLLMNLCKLVSFNVAIVLITKCILSNTIIVLSITI